MPLSTSRFNPIVLWGFIVGIINRRSLQEATLKRQELELDVKFKKIHDLSDSTREILTRYEDGIASPLHDDNEEN